MLRPSQNTGIARHMDSTLLLLRECWSVTNHRDRGLEGILNPLFLFCPQSHPFTLYYLPCLGDPVLVVFNTRFVTGCCNEPCRVLRIHEAIANVFLEIIKP